MAIIAALMPLDVFTNQMEDHHLERFRRIDTKTDFFQISTIEELIAHPKVGEVEVFVTGWGSPRITPSLLNKCPSLRLIAHCAGTIRNLIDPALFDHQIRITNSADANAVPVPEFLLS